MRGDCLEKMSKIKDGSVDLTVTSPPYDNLRSYNGNNDQWGEHVWKPVLEGLFRITKNGGVVVWVVNDATIKGSETGTSFKQALYAIECGFRLHDTMIWEKTGVAFPESNRYYPHWEYMFIFSKEKLKTCNQIIDRENKSVGKIKVSCVERSPSGKNDRRPRRITVTKKYGVRYNIWKQSASRANISGHHAIFSLKLVSDHIISWSNKGDIVLDPFMGSGTTAVACKELGRKFIGFELEQKYCDVANERLRKAEPDSNQKNIFSFV